MDHSITIPPNSAKAHTSSLSPLSLYSLHTHPSTPIYRQVMGIALVFLGQLLETELPADQVGRANCQTRDSHTNSSLPCSSSFYNSNSIVNSGNTVTPYDFSHAMLLYLSLVTCVLVLMVVAFHPKYRRISAEKKAKFEESVHIQSNNN